MNLETRKVTLRNGAEKGTFHRLFATSFLFLIIAMDENSSLAAKI